MFLCLVRSVILADGYVRGDHSHNLDSVTKLSFLASNFHDEFRSESLVGTMGRGRGGEVGACAGEGLLEDN